MLVPAIGVISGTPNTGLENSSVFIRDVDPMLYFYETDKHPIMSMLLTQGMTLGYRENTVVPKVSGKSLRKKARKNFKVEFFEDQIELAQFYNPAAAVTTSATSITVASAAIGSHFRLGDILLLTNVSGQTERLYVSSVSTTTVNVTNPDGTTRTAGIAMTTADRFYLMENVRAEDSTAPGIRTTQRANMYNYLEIVDEPYGLTKTKLATSDYNGDPLMLEKRKAFSRLVRRLEKMFWWGTRTVANSTTNPIYSTGGWNYFAELYSDVEIRDFAGLPLTKAEFFSFLTAVARGGATNKVLVCGSRVLSFINNFVLETVRPDTFSIGEFGMNIRKVMTPLGEYTIVYEPLFDEISIMAGSMVVLDFDHIQFNYLSNNGVNLDIHDEEQLLADGSTAKKGQYIGQVGFTFETLKTMGMILNVGA